MREKIYLACLLFCAPNAAMADSLLTPTHFPKTFDDVNFSDRYAVLAEDYEQFTELTPYEQLEIIETDAGINEQIEQDEQEINDDTDADTDCTDKKDCPDDNKNDEQKTNDNTNNVTPATTARYCAVYNSTIPAGQTIPVGKPVYENDYRPCSKYGWRKIKKTDGTWVWDFHYGFDIGCTNAHKGRPVFAIADGVVEIVSKNGPGRAAGNYISINHGNGWVTKYMHLRNMLVKKGERVQAGCQIATIGNTGGAKANRESFKNNQYPKMSENAYHLHYAIYYTGKNTAVTVGDRTIPIVHKSGHRSVDPAPFMGISSKYFYKP
ncbi:MAG: M23 family metallopeptidase [Alphaproteobacteria bacterium]